mgnify:FL=1
MKISFFTNSLHRWPIEKSFEVASRFGYDGIEIWGGRPHAYAPDMRPEDIQKIKDLSVKYNLPIVSFEPEMACLLWRDQRWIDESMEYFGQCIDFCKAIGCPYMVMAALQCSYEYSTDEDWAQFIKYMKELAAYSESVDGVTMILETVTPWEGNILIRSDDTVRALKEIDSPKVKAMLDLAAPLTVGEPSSNYFEKLGKDLVHVHLVDCKKDVEDHLILGDGELPVEEVLSMLDSYGYDGYCSVELFDEYRTEPILFNQRAIRAIRQSLENVGLKQG